MHLKHKANYLIRWQLTYQVVACGWILFAVESQTFLSRRGIKNPTDGRRHGGLCVLVFRCRAETDRNPAFDSYPYPYFQICVIL